MLQSHKKLVKCEGVWTFYTEITFDHFCITRAPDLKNKAAFELGKANFVLN